MKRISTITLFKITYEVIKHCNIAGSYTADAITVRLIRDAFACFSP